MKSKTQQYVEEFDTLTLAQQDFVIWQTKALMPKWADWSLTYGTEANLQGVVKADDSRYFAYAHSKGWISSRGDAVTTKGFKIATNYLRRGFPPSAFRQAPVQNERDNAPDKG